MRIAGESALLKVENQDCGVEVVVSHGGTCSAAPIAQNEFSSGSAIANKTPGIVLQGKSAPFLAQNQALGEEPKTDHKDSCSVAPVPNAEKWSHEAIVARANARPLRMQKLKVALNSGENPGFDFLQECWNDPAKADCDQEVAGEVSAVGDCDCRWGVGEVGRVASAVV